MILLLLFSIKLLLQSSFNFLLTLSFGKLINLCIWENFKFTISNFSIDIKFSYEVSSLLYFKKWYKRKIDISNLV